MYVVLMLMNLTKLRLIINILFLFETIEYTARKLKKFICNSVQKYPYHCARKGSEKRSINED